MPPLAATKYLRAQSQEQVTAEEYSAAVSSLTTAGVRTTHDLLLQPDLLPGIPHSRTLHTLRQLVAAHHAAPGTTAFSQLTVSPVAPLSTTIPALDDLLHGGVGFGAVTEVLGAAGCGRTRMATLLAMQLVRSHPSALVYYVHSDAMPLSRLHGSREQLERVLAVECRTMDRLLSFLYGLAAEAADPAPQDDAPRLVVVDNVRDLAVAELQRTGD
ncbi:DNA repair protein RAD51, partial [Coemansia sp. RSA 2607]